MTMQNCLEHKQKYIVEIDFLLFLSFTGCIIHIERLDFINSTKINNLYLLGSFYTICCDIR